MKNSNKTTNSQKFILFFIDIAFVAIIATIFIFALNYKNAYSSNQNAPNDNETASISDNSAGMTEDELLASNTNTDSNDFSDNSSENSNELFSDNSSSNNSVSDDSISDNSLSDNSVSEDSVSVNSLLSYEIPDAPVVMNYPSGTMINLGDVDLNNLGNYFLIMDIPADIESYITGKSYTPNESITLQDLRYIKVLHFNFEHRVQIGEIIVNASIANEIRDIFMSLFVNEYEIQSMYLPDKYWCGDGNETDKASCEANNTSGFFYRTVNGTTKLSNHAMGKAIDINPQQNPYVSYKNGYPECEHENALVYIDRATGLPHLITENDLCYQLFVARGYTWGGAWNSIKDYQHFEK